MSLRRYPNEKIALIVSVVVLFAAVISFGGRGRGDPAEAKKFVGDLSWNERMHALMQAWLEEKGIKPESPWLNHHKIEFNSNKIDT